MPEIASLIATLVGTFPGVELGPLYYRNIEYDKDTVLQSAFGDYEYKMCLSADRHADLLEATIHSGFGLKAKLAIAISMFMNYRLLN